MPGVGRNGSTAIFAKSRAASTLHSGDKNPTRSWLSYTINAGFSTQRSPMLDHETHVKIADELHQANIDRQPVQLLTKRYPGMVIEDSYAIQKIWADRQIETGRRKAGHKIGLTSKAMQAATGIDEPDYGVIFDDQVFESGHVFEWKKYTHPRIEIELAFVLKDDLRGPNVNIFDVLRATEYVTPALEVLDAHIEMEGRTIIDTISDNAALGAMVLGGSP